MKKIILRTNQTALVLMVTLLLTDCSKTKDPAPAAQNDVEYFGTTSPGDVWVAAFNTQRNTYAATWDRGTKADPSDDVVFSGTFTKTSKGFIAMSVTATSKPVTGIAVDGTYKIYARELAGKSLVMLPDTPAAVNGAPRFGVITMAARSTKTGTNGIHKFNFIRTAFPYAGYDLVNQDGCWGTFSWNIDEAAGTVSLSEGIYSMTLSCAQNVFDPTVPCSLNVDATIPVNTTLGTIGSLGEFTQTANVGGDLSKKYTGQFNIANGIFVMDQGDGQGGSYMFKEDPSLTLSDFNMTASSGEFFGFGTFLGGRNGTGGYTISSKAYSVYTDPRLPAGYISFHELRGPVSDEAVESDMVWAVKFEFQEKGRLVGSMYNVVSNTLGSQKLGVAAMGYKNGNNKMLVIVSGDQANSRVFVLTTNN